MLVLELQGGWGGDLVKFLEPKHEDLNWDFLGPM